MSFDTTILLHQDIIKLVSRIKNNPDVTMVNVLRLQTPSMQPTLLSHALVVLLQPHGGKDNIQDLTLFKDLEGIIRDLGTVIHDYKPIANDTWVVTLASAASFGKRQLLITFREEA